MLSASRSLTSCPGAPDIYTLANLPMPTDISASWLYVGCFTDPLPASNASEPHALSGSYLYSLDLTPVRCATFCQQGGFALAAVEYATQCTCGNDLRSSAQLTVESRCDSPCAGNQAAKCGGTYHMNVFVNRNLLDAIASQSSAALGEATSSTTRPLVSASSSAVRASSSAAAVTTRSLASSSAALSGFSTVVGSSSAALAAAASSSSAVAAAAAAAEGGASSSADGGGVSGGTIAGAVIGALAGLALLGASLFLLCRRRRRRQHRAFAADEKASGAGSAIALGAGDAWAQQGSGGSSEEGGTSAMYEKSGSGLHSELGGAHDTEAQAGGPGAALALAETAAGVGGLASRRNSSGHSVDDLHPHEMPYVLGPVIPASPLLGPGAGLLASTPTPSESWRSAPLVTEDDPAPQKEPNRRASMPLNNGDIHAPPLGPLPLAPDGSSVLRSPSGRSRSTEISRIVSPFADPPPPVHARRPSTALSGNPVAAAPLVGGGRRPSEGSTTSLGGRSPSVSKQARKPVPALVDGDAPALEQQQYYNADPATSRKASETSTSSAAELLGGAQEMLREDGVGLPSNEPSPSAGVGASNGTKTPDLFKGWDGRQLRTLDVDEPLKQ